MRPVNSSFSPAHREAADLIIGGVNLEGSRATKDARGVRNLGVGVATDPHYKKIKGWNAK
jgi:hypothetical protein